MDANPAIQQSYRNHLVPPDIHTDTSQATPIPPRLTASPTSSAVSPPPFAFRQPQGTERVRGGGPGPGIPRFGVMDRCHEGRAAME